MRFEKIRKVDNEVLKLFRAIRSNFTKYGRSAISQLKWIIKDSALFYKVYDEGRFIGCLFADRIDEECKTIEFGGFAHRHVNTRQALSEFMGYLRFHYPEYRIVAITDKLAAKISLTRAGLTKKKEGYIYE